MNEILGIIIAAIVCWLNFVIIDTFMGLPEQPGVIGAKNIGEDVKNWKQMLADVRRCRSIPAAGALLKEEDGDQMRLL